MYQVAARGQLGHAPQTWRWGRPGLGEGEDIVAFQAPPPQVFPPVPLTIENLQRYLWDYGQAAATDQDKRAAFEALAQVSGMARAGADLATICAQAGKRWPLVSAACTSVPMVVAPIGGLPIPIPLPPASPPAVVPPPPAPPPAVVPPPPAPPVFAPAIPPPVVFATAQAPAAPPAPLPFGFTTSTEAGGGIPSVAAVPTSEAPAEAVAPAPTAVGFFGWIGLHPVLSLTALAMLVAALLYGGRRLRQRTRGRKVGVPTVSSFAPSIGGSRR